MAGRRIHEALPCPQCESLNTRFRGWQRGKVRKKRYSCNDCEKNWTVGGQVGGDRRSDFYHQEVEQQIKAEANQPIPADDGSAFGQYRTIGKESFKLLKSFSDTENPDKAKTDAQTYRKAIAAQYSHARVIKSYERPGHYAVYARGKGKMSRSRGNFAKQRNIGGRSFKLLKVFSDVESPEKAKADAQGYKKAIAGNYDQVRLLISHEKGTGNHTGHYAIYAR